MKNKEFYQKVKISKKDLHIPIIFSTYWPLYILGNLLAISIAPVFGKYNMAAFSLDEYYRVWGISAVVVLVLNVIFTWFIEVRPYLDKRKGFYWRGCFTVIEKASPFGYKSLMLSPGTDHKIKVRNEFYNSIRCGDRIFLERSYLGDTMRIRKISGFLERVKKMKNTTSA